MIVEFIGCTGAGKTTLIAEVQRELAQTATVASAFAVVATPLGLQTTVNPTAQNLIQEVVGLPFFFGSLLRTTPFLVYIAQMILRHGKFDMFTIHYLRSLERTIGVYEILRHFGRGKIVLVDEGTLVPAHNVFVYNDAQYTAAEIAQFANLAPLPDVIIYVKAPVDTLVTRALQRRDPPREFRARDPRLIGHFIRRAVAMFEQLVRAEKIRQRVFVVENHAATAQERHVLVAAIARFILDCAVAGRDSTHRQGAELEIAKS